MKASTLTLTQEIVDSEAAFRIVQENCATIYQPVVSRKWDLLGIAETTSRKRITMPNGGRIPISRAS